MDSSSPNLEHKNEEAAARLAIFDRLMRIPLECGDDLERMAQAYCVAAAETFGDLATITILNRHNELMHMAGLHDVDPQALTLLQDVIAAAATTDMPRDRGLGANVIRTGEPLLLPAVPSELLHSVQFPAWNRFIESVGLGSIMIAPLRGRSGNIGSITLGRHTGGRPYDDDDLELLTAMCLRISMALENTLLVDSLRAQIATASSIEAALSASEDRFRSLFGIRQSRYSKSRRNGKVNGETDDRVPGSTV